MERRCSCVLICNTASHNLGALAYRSCVSNLSVQGNWSRCESMVGFCCLVFFFVILKVKTVSGEKDEKPK